MTNKVIIIVTLALLLVSFTVLFAVEKMNDNYDYNKSWNVVYFNNPSDNSLNFTIENHQGAKGEYAYEILADGQSLSKNTVEIPAVAKQEVKPDLDVNKIKRQNAAVRISVEISLGDLKYNIYKNIK
jgi:hypothetical protein